MDLRSSVGGQGGPALGVNDVGQSVELVNDSGEDAPRSAEIDVVDQAEVGRCSDLMMTE